MYIRDTYVTETKLLPLYWCFRLNSNLLRSTCYTAFPFKLFSRLAEARENLGCFYSLNPTNVTQINFKAWHESNPNPKISLAGKHKQQTIHILRRRVKGETRGTWDQQRFLSPVRKIVLAHTKSKNIIILSFPVKPSPGNKLRLVFYWSIPTQSTQRSTHLNILKYPECIFQDP